LTEPAGQLGTQAPTAGSQVSPAWHLDANTQAPVAGSQESVVQGLLSSQTTVVGVLTHPVAELQLSIVQALLSLQSIGV
jgi:hypothetical protein